MLQVLYHHANFGEAPISPATRAAKNVEFFVCLFVCHAFECQEFVRTISPWRRWSTETILIPLIPLDRERFVVVHPCSIFSDCHELATPQNVQF